jgi:beta-lactamase class D
MPQFRSIQIKANEPKLVLRAKTGWAIGSGADIGWYVSYLERTNNMYYFALNVDIDEQRRGLECASMTRKILEQLGLLSEALECAP